MPREAFRTAVRVGTVTAIKGDNLVIKTDKHEVQLPKSSFTFANGKALFGMTQAQLNAEVAIAYEPIWAIGTGKVPTTGEIGEMHAALRKQLSDAYGDRGERVRILYGGSVKPANAEEIFRVANVDGALVGGASLKTADFMPIVAAAAAVG